MNGINWFASPFELVNNLTQPIQANRGKTKAGRKRASTDIDRELGFLPLVPEAGLFFRVVAANPPAWFGEPPADESVRLAVDAFRGLFTEVWARLPADDQQQLLDYWRFDSFPSLASDPFHKPPHRPLIHLVDAWPRSGLVNAARFGHELSFPGSLARKQPDRVRSLISRTLALVWRMATREHWGMILRTIDEPLERWERRQGKATDRERAEKEAVLGETFRRKHEIAIASVLRRWGLEETRSPERRLSTKREKETA
jgi:hypothetical protein